MSPISSENCSMSDMISRSVEAFPCLEVELGMTAPLVCALQGNITSILGLACPESRPSYAPVDENLIQAKREKDNIADGRAIMHALSSNSPLGQKRRSLR